MQNMIQQAHAGQTDEILLDVRGAWLRQPGKQVGSLWGSWQAESAFCGTYALHGSSDINLTSKAVMSALMLGDRLHSLLGWCESCRQTTLEQCQPGD